MALVTAWTSIALLLLPLLLLLLVPPLLLLPLLLLWLLLRLQMALIVAVAAAACGGTEHLATTCGDSHSGQRLGVLSSLPSGSRLGCCGGCGSTITTINFARRVQGRQRRESSGGDDIPL
ncbi:hypothetical protein CLOP_g5237 [Closterium sp. NIES-67]|nr:hypothetical protein CLOP_g5237 [Closterium sp. NIES-67]